MISATAFESGGSAEVIKKTSLSCAFRLRDVYGPIQNNFDRRRHSIRRICGYEESTTSMADCVVETHAEPEGSRRPCLEEHLGSRGFEVSAWSNADRHQCSIGREVVELQPVIPPTRIGSAAGGDEPGATRRAERPHEYIEPSRFI